MKRAFAVISILIALSLLSGAGYAQEGKQRNWTKTEIMDELTGRSREEIEELLGTPDHAEMNGKYWSYYGLKVKDEESGVWLGVLRLEFTSDTGGKVDSVSCDQGIQESRISNLGSLAYMRLIAGNGRQRIEL